MGEPARRLAAPDGAEAVVDALLPVELDWRRLVDRYPLTSLAVAGVGGYLLGRSRGAGIVAAVAAFTRDAVEANVGRLLSAD